MNICLIGNNLTNLTLANILDSKNINIDIISQNSLPRINTNRTIAVSNQNYKFLKQNIKGFYNLGWPTEKIKIYSEKNSKNELFEFKSKNQNNFYLLKYKKLHDLLRKKKSQSLFILGIIIMKL